MGDKSKFFAIFAALLATAFRVTSVSPSTKTPHNQTATLKVAEERRGPDGKLLRTLTDFDKRRKFVSPWQTKTNSCDVGVRNISVRPMNWAIAIVPDPEHSNLKLDFDREVEAIQNAAESADYQFERFWFPWHADSAGTSTDESSDGTVIGPDDIPGILLFRHPTKSGFTTSLAIMLVGETPTSGINPAQFHYAVCLGGSFSNQWTNKSPIRVIGPGYSASFDSLATLSEDHQLVVRSWTSDLSSQLQFIQQLGKRASLDTLKTTLTPSTASINTFICFVRQQWKEDGPIVLLREEGTGLGSGIKPERETQTDPADCAVQSNVDSDNSRIRDSKVYTVQFPRNLSTLRNASESQANAAGSKDPQAELPHTGLQLSLKQEQTSFEIPNFAVDQTPVSQESELFEISALLKTGTIHYVGIIASDPLDTLFLTRYLRSACPNLRLFILDPDILLEHGSDSSDFQGILTVSTFPLFPMSQLWTGSRRNLHIFPSRVFEGIYNATVDSLSTSGQPSSDSPPHFADFRNPFEDSSGSHLPLWLTIAGRTGFEPITVLKSPDVQFMEKPQGGPPRFSPVYWESWGYSFCLLLVLCLAYCGALAAASPSESRTLALFAVKPRERGAAIRALYLSATGASLSLLVLPWLLVPGQIIVENLQSEPDLPRLKLFAFLLFCCGGLASFGLFALTKARRCGAPDRSTRKGRSYLLSPGSPASVTGFSCSTASLAFFLISASTPSLAGTRPVILDHLWHLFCFGSFVLGAVITASACPVWDLFASPAMAGRKHATRIFTADLRDPANALATLLSGWAVATILFVYFSFLVKSAYDPDDFLAACRALDLTSGVSPLVPASFLIIVLVGLALVHLQRIVCYEDRCPIVPEFRHDLFCPRLRRSVAETRRRTSRLKLHPAHVLAAGALGIFFYRILHSHSHQTFESPNMERFLIYGSIIAGFFLLLVWIRILLIWVSFSEFLQQLERHPLRNIFSLLPRGFVWSPVWQGGGKKRTHVAITRSLECILALRAHPGTPVRLRQIIETRIGPFQLDVKRLLEISASRRRIPRALYIAVERHLSAIASAAVGQLESDKWAEGGYELKAELSVREGTKEALRVREDRYVKEEPATICGELIAFRFLAFINYVLWQLDNLVGFLSVGFLLLVVALNSYAFRSATIIDWVLVMMFLVLTSGIVTVFAQADRDAILSRITGTQEGKLDRHFFIHLISYGALPLLVLAATHFPTVGKFFFSWVKPALEAIH